MHELAITALKRQQPHHLLCWVGLHADQDLTVALSQQQPALRMNAWTLPALNLIARLSSVSVC